MASKRLSLKKLKSLAYEEQSGCCIYCDKPMWLHDPKSFARRFNLTPKQAQQLQCTGEHLVRYSAGGKPTRKNIAAAHRYCNCMRHKGGKDATPDMFRDEVQRSLGRGKWFPFPVALR